MGDTHDVAIFVYEPTDDALPPVFRARCSCGWLSMRLHDRRDAHNAGFNHEDGRRRARPAPEAGGEGE